MSSAEILKRHHLRKTDIREKVLEVFIDSSRALSNEDIEKHFEKLDRITLYRTLKTFEESGLIHRIPHSGQAPLYAICQEDCSHHEHLDQHGHFHCLKCGVTICMEEVHVPAINLPDGFTAQQKHLVIEGKCAKCT